MSSSESWCVIEDGGAWNSGKFRCVYTKLGSLNSRVVDLAFLLDLCVCFCSHKVSLSSPFLRRRLLTLIIALSAMCWYLLISRCWSSDSERLS